MIMDSAAFHSSPEQYKTYSERSIDNAVTNGRISQSDVKYVKEFITEVNIQNNLSPQRKFKLTCNLMNVVQYMPSIENMTIPDLYEAVENIKNATKENGKPYTQNTKADLLRILKRFCVWLSESGYNDMDIQKIRKIRVPGYTSKVKTEDSILTEEEVLKLIKTPRSIRYRTLLGVLYEGGFRIQEIAQMKWSDVRFSEWGARIRTAGKTEKERTIPIIMYKNTLANWKSEHPDPSPDNFVFLNDHNRPLKYQSVLKTVSKFAKEAGIDKKITLHIFRHSRVTHCLQRGMQETILKETFWGNPTTDMLKVYSHLTPADAESEFARMAGVELPGDHVNDGVMKPTQCGQCHFINPPGARFCGRCGVGLTAEIIKSTEQAFDKIEKWLYQHPSEMLKMAEEIRNSEN